MTMSERATGVEVRRCTQADIDLLTRDDPAHRAWRDVAHHRTCWRLQGEGRATYLLAWRDGAVVGRVTLLHWSKYPEVSEAYPDLWEINALEANPKGQGVGTLLIAAAEAEARQQGAGHIGLGVEPVNPGARRLYDRLGFTDWGRGTIVDVWTERDRAGEVLRRHHDTCHYLLKPL